MQVLKEDAGVFVRLQFHLFQLLLEEVEALSFVRHVLGDESFRSSCRRPYGRVVACTDVGKWTLGQRL